MTKYLIESETLTDIADAIRDQTGESSPIEVAQMAAEIASIQGGGSSYSTTEHEVGTWADGLTIYEISLEVNSITASTGWITVGTVSGINKLIDGEVCFKASTDDYCYSNLPIAYTYATGAVIVYNGLGGILGTVSGYVTIRYTKATT